MLFLHAAHFTRPCAEGLLPLNRILRSELVYRLKFHTAECLNLCRAGTSAKYVLPRPSEIIPSTADANKLKQISGGGERWLTGEARKNGEDQNDEPDLDQSCIIP